MSQQNPSLRPLHNTVIRSDETFKSSASLFNKNRERQTERRGALMDFGGEVIMGHTRADSLPPSPAQRLWRWFALEHCPLRLSPRSRPAAAAQIKALTYPERFQLSERLREVSAPLSAVSQDYCPIGGSAPSHSRWRSFSH